jgi:hypothetical protein
VLKIAMILGASDGPWEPNRIAMGIHNRNNGSTNTKIIVCIESGGRVVSGVDRAGQSVTAMLGAGSSRWQPNNRARVVCGSKARFEK